MISPCDTLKKKFSHLKILFSAEQQKPYCIDQRKNFNIPALAVISPTSKQDLIEIISFCESQQLFIIPQGGNTSTAGGAVPSSNLGNRSLIISFSKMNQILEIDPYQMTITAEPGVTLEDLHHAAHSKGLFFPLKLPSQEKCQIGGNVSTNAGGLTVLKYGNSEDLVLAEEIITSKGKVLSNFSKNVPWLCVSRGAEGTLGVLSKVKLRLFPMPQEEHAFLLGLEHLEALIPLFQKIQAYLGWDLTSFELIPDLSFQTQGVKPLSKAYPWYIYGSSQSSLSLIQQALKESKLSDFLMAQTEEKNETLWLYRKNTVSSQKHLGPSLKHDLSVPLKDIPRLIKEGSQKAQTLMPDIRPYPFGHVGDGNIHFNFSAPEGMDKKTFFSLSAEITKEIHALTLDLNGSIAAEHGIGQLKRKEVNEHWSDTEKKLVDSLKRSFDSKNLFNPDKIMPYTSKSSS